MTTAELADLLRDVAGALDRAAAVVATATAVAELAELRARCLIAAHDLAAPTRP